MLIQVCSKMKVHNLIIPFLLTLLFLTTSACSTSTEPLPTLMPQAYVLGTESAPSSFSTRLAQTVATENGVFDIPGTGYIDGRDLEANPSLTIMEVKVWDGVDYLRRPICRLPHGTQVKILDIKQDPDFDDTWYHFQIQGSSCEGWLTWRFVNTEKHDPVGDRIYDN